MGPPAPNGLGYNALAFNPADNYLYAIVTAASPAIPVGSLVRIGQGGTVKRVGTNTFGASFAGAFHSDGLMYINHSNGLRAINAATGTTQRNIAITGTELFDFTSAGGFLWGMRENGTVERIGVGPTPSFKTFPGVIPATGGPVGAAWTYGNGNLGFSVNHDGAITQLEVTNPGAANPTFEIVNVTTGPSSRLNDGAAIPGYPIDLSVEKIAPPYFLPGEAIPYTVTVTNNSNTTSSGSTASDTLPTGLTLDPAGSSSNCSAVG